MYTYELCKGSFGIVVDDFTFSMFEKPIEKFTGDGHHTFCYLGNGKISEAHLGKGVTIQDIDKYMDGKSSVLMVIPNMGYFSNRDIEAVIARWQEDIGKKYEKMNLLAKKFRLFRRWVSDERRICSEHTAWGYSGLHRFNNKSYRDVAPSDILKDVVYGSEVQFHKEWLHNIL